MFLANLTLAEFLVLFTAISATVTLLYLLDRARRRLTVATLRFWTKAEKLTESRRRRRIRQPLSLLLQILSIMLLLLAAAQLRWGAADVTSRDHVLIVDTSAWMMARSEQGTLMDEARSLALGYLRALPSGDRVMLVRADALAIPVTAFESNRKLVEQAILDSQPGFAALHLDEALRFARRIRTLNARRPGEIVFVGAGRYAETDAASSLPAVENLRVLRVKTAVENAGLRKVGLRHSESEADLWEVYVSVRNYGDEPRSVDLAMQFNGSPAGSRRLRLSPASDGEATFPLRTRAAGLLEVRLFTDDGFPDDDQAVLEIPARRSIEVAVYSEQPDLLRPVLEANPFIAAVYRRPSEYRDQQQPRIAILDRFRPPVPPTCDVIWIEPPAGASPVPVRAVVKDVALGSWRSDHPIASGLRTQDLRLTSAQVFETESGYDAVAEVAEGAVMVARAGTSSAPNKSVVLGFHPMRSAMRYELAAPLLFANIIRWMEPGIFRSWELNAGSVGAVELALEPGLEASDIQIVTEDGNPVPATFQDNTVRFFSGTPGVVRVIAGDRETVYSLTLPEVAEAVWEVPEGARQGVPAAMSSGASSRDLWWWLAILGGLGLLVEWLWFGRFRKWDRAPGAFAGMMAWRWRFRRQQPVVSRLDSSPPTGPARRAS